MLQLENTGIEGLAFPPPKDSRLSVVTAFAIAALPSERFGAEALFKEISNTLIANIRELSKHQPISREESDEMEVAAYLVTCAWISSPKNLSHSLNTLTEVFFRTFPDWRKSEKNIRSLLLAVTDGPSPRSSSRAPRLFRDAVTAYDARKDFEEPMILRRRLFEDDPGAQDDQAWLSEEIARLRGLRFSTLSGDLLFGKRLEKNIDELESIRARRLGNRTSGDVQKITLTIYRSVSRNMIDMISLADRKAALLLKANAISLGVLVTFFGRALSFQPRIAIAYTSIAVTCALTVILSALASRPLKRNYGRIDLDRFFSDGLSLLHYGDAARLSREEFLLGFKAASNNPELLERSLLSEIHFFANRIIQKFRMVRHAYLAMILGIVLSCLSLLFVHLL